MKNRAQGAIEYLLIIGAAILVVAIVTGAVMTIIQQGQTQNTEGITKQDTTYTGLKNLTGKTEISLGQLTVLTISEEKEISAFVSLPNGSTITIGTTKYTKTNDTWNNSTAILPAGSTILIYAPGSGTIDLETGSTTKPTTTVDCSTLGNGIKTIYDTTSSTDHNVFCGASGKMWAKAATTTMTQANAITHCNNLVYANFDDWRLPKCTTRALGSGCELYQYGMDICGWNGICGSNYTWNGTTLVLTPSPYTNCSACSSTLNLLDPSSPSGLAWSDETGTSVYMTLASGRVYYNPSTITLTRSVRCVR